MRRSRLAFSLKAGVFRTRRAIGDARRRVRRWPVDPGQTGALLAEISTPLRPNAGAIDPREMRLVAGKIENLRIALRRLDGAMVPANQTFSFWRQIGRATRRAGYVEGRELREGCIVPSVGGGLCQLSNALYAAALEAGCEIVERHAHSQIVPGSFAEAGRDATVFWNYVDLRFRSNEALTIRATLEADRLIVRFYGSPARTLAEPPRGGSAASEGSAPSCASCDVTSCRHFRVAAVAHAGRTAVLVDAYWPEYDAYLRERVEARDLLCLPLDGRRFGLPQYGWSSNAFAEVRQAPLETLMRALQSRTEPPQGRRRQEGLLLSAERLAARFARELRPDVEHIVVAQTLLPFLWRAGHLGGRTFDVLMSGPPMLQMHAALDAAARLHPESATLDDFRADAALVEAELAALAHARKIVTPHSDVARRFGARAELLPWQMPPSSQREARVRAEAVLFPASTLGRSGAYELREAAQRLDLPVVLVGSHEFEGADFWHGTRVTRVPDFASGLAGSSVVVLPAFVENRPRRLLQALASGVPVITTPACGLGEREGVAIVPPGDAGRLASALTAASRASYITSAAEP